MNKFVKISYIGKIKESQQIFDKADDIIIVLGAGHVLKPIEENLEKMQINEKKQIEIQPEQGFEQRNPELVKLVPLSEFRKHNTKPVPGMVIDADNKRGRILSVSSGRVKVDFNHPLAGKVLVYEIEYKQEVTNLQEKVKGLMNFYTRIPAEKFQVIKAEDHLEIIVPPAIHPALKKKISDDIIKFLDFKKVKFSEIFEEK